MKILFISIYDPFSHSGPGNHLHWLSNALIDCGCEVHILTPGPITKCVKTEGLIIHYIKSLPAAKGFLFSLTSIGHVNRIVDRYKIDIIHGQSPSSFGYALLSKSKTPFVVTVHGTSFGEILAFTKTPLSNLTTGVIRDSLLVQPLTAVLTLIEYKFADKMIAISMQMAEETKRFYHLPDEKVIVIHNGINIPAKKMELQQFSDLKIILVVGRLIWRKGIGYLIEALPLIIAKYPMTQLLIIGEGEQKVVLEQLIHNSGVTSSVRFLSDVSDEELRDLYQQTDVYVQPSLYEPLGIAIMEAMSNGKPVVASNVGGIPELITNTQEGILVEPSNVKQLSEAIIYLLSSLTLRETYGARGREKILEFSWDKIAKKTIKLYQSFR